MLIDLILYIRCMLHKPTVSVFLFMRKNKITVLFKIFNYRLINLILKRILNIEFFYMNKNSSIIFNDISESILYNSSLFMKFSKINFKINKCKIIFITILSCLVFKSKSLLINVYIYFYALKIIFSGSILTIKKSLAYLTDPREFEMISF